MVQDRVHVPRADTIHPDSILRPLGRERIFELQECAFGNIVRHLWLWEVDAVCRDRSCEDDAATCLLPHHLAVDERWNAEDDQRDHHLISAITEERITYLLGDSLCTEPAPSRVDV